MTTTFTYTFEQLEAERAAYEALLQRLGEAPMADIQQTLAEREEVAPEADLDPKAVAHWQQYLAGEA